MKYVTMIVMMLFTSTLFAEGTINERSNSHHYTVASTFTIYPAYEQTTHTDIHNIHYKPTESEISVRDAYGLSTLWVHESWLSTVNDNDGDGLYSGFSLMLDIDTDYDQQDLFVELILVDSYGEEIPIYRSDRFTLVGESSADRLQIDTQLEEGFFPDGYQLIIAIYDFHSGQWLQDYQLLDHGELAYIPLESHEYDDHYETIQVSVSSSYTNGSFLVQHTTTYGHAGSLTLGSLLFSLGLISIRRYQSTANTY